MNAQLIKKILLTGTLLLFSILLVPAGSGQHAFAQTGDLEWEPPVNLSQSGSAADPRFVVDSEGRLHVIWRDIFADYRYSMYDGEVWTEPEATSFPFDLDGSSAPELLADENGTVHAFWTDDSNNLRYSRVNANFFGVRFRWTPSVRLDFSISEIDGHVDELGRIQLAYVKFEDLAEKPAGIYHLRSNNRGLSWSLPKALYTSPYLRSEEPEDGNLDIDSSLVEENPVIHVVWDNPVRERVFYSYSVDNGQSWAPPLEADAPDDSSDSTSPFNIRLFTGSEQLLMIWQVGIVTEECNSLYQLSTDAGLTWTEPEILRDDFTGCQAAVDFIPLAADTAAFLSKGQDEYYLSVWNGSEWSDMAFQKSLSEFQDPDTFNELALDCPQVTTFDTDRLFFLGCATDASEDIWITNRSIGPLEEWFREPEAQTWSLSSPINFSTQAMDSLLLISDSEERFHALWDLAPTSEALAEAPPIYYSRLEDGTWSTPNPILTSPAGPASQPSLAIDATNRLHVVWTAPDSGEIYYSWAQNSLAITASEWSEPLLLSRPEQGAASPEIYIAPTGFIYVVYAVPLNDLRGIYITASRDEGATWAPIIRLFDAAGSGWEMVDEPKITGALDGSLHLVFTKFTLPSGTGALGTYYTKSIDVGQTWEQPISIVDRYVDWTSVLGGPSGKIHRIWQQLNFGIPTLVHQFTSDLGFSWLGPANLPGLSSGGPSDVVMDPAAQLHLLNIFKDVTGSYRLQHWSWDGLSWISEDGRNLGDELVVSADTIAAAVSPSGRLLSVFEGKLPPIEDEEDQYALFVLGRSIDMPAGTLNNSFTATPAPTATPQSTATPDVELTPTAVPLNLNEDPPDPSQLTVWGLDPTWLAPIIGLIAAAAVVILVVAYVAIRSRAQSGT